jgi:hypothetical protein
VNNQKVHYEFGFNGVFDNTTSQETIFSRVAEKAVLSAVQGYNATIFAYGQTGSGKTWSITGGINKYAMLLCSYALMLLCSYALMLLCSYALMLLCSYALML